MKRSPNHPHTILWADDDPDDLLLIRHIVEGNAANVSLREAANGQEVLSYLQSLQSPARLPSLVVLDINMPLLNGLETLRLLKQDSRLMHLPVAIFTTSSSPLDRMVCKMLGVSMLTKPTKYDAFKQAVINLLSLCDRPTEQCA